MKSYIEIPVRGYHLDMFSHVNNARYLEFLEEARWHALESSGFGFKELGNRGLAFAVVNININYRFPATVGDIITIDTSVARMSKRSVTMSQTMTLKSDDRAVVDAEVTFVIMDAESGTALELTDELKSVFIPN